MRPRLRKVVACLLASATLFGGGALSTATALADDSAVDKSAQIKTDTTDGNNTKNQNDVHADTGVRARQAPEAAPDVTIHDMLDTDTASVSKLKLTGWTTGTAPFDKDNERGDDKDDNNAIVRSYDTVTYDYDYTLTPDNAMAYYRKARVGFRFELPYPKDKVTFATDQMNWVDQTPGYTAKVTQEGDR